LSYAGASSKVRPLHRPTHQPLLENQPYPLNRPQDINCTIPFISDPLFHLLEFYIHNDAPMTCRIPSRPLPASSPSSSPTTINGLSVAPTAPTTNDLYVPLIIAITGTLQLSHLHIANNLNVLLHAAPRASDPGAIDSATAYSVSHNSRNVRVVIGDALPLRLSVRWYPTTALPSGWRGVGGHLFVSTLFYCLLSAGAAFAVSVAYFRGVEFPKRLRAHGRERVGGERVGYGYGGAVNGYGIGKRD